MMTKKKKKKVIQINVREEQSFQSALIIHIYHLTFAEANIQDVGFGED